MRLSIGVQLARGGGRGHGQRAGCHEGGEGGGEAQGRAHDHSRIGSPRGRLKRDARRVDRSSSGDRPSVQAARRGREGRAARAPTPCAAASQDPPGSRRPTTLDRAFGTAAPPSVAPARQSTSAATRPSRGARRRGARPARRARGSAPRCPRTTGTAPRAASRRPRRSASRSRGTGCTAAARARRRARGSGVSAIRRRNVVGRRRAALSWPPWPTSRPARRPARSRRRALRPEPDRHAAPGQPAHRRCWPGCFARAAGARFLVRIEDLDAGRVREPFVAEQLADLAALGLDHDGEVVRQSARTGLLRGGDSRGCATRRARLPLLVHARGDPRGGIRAARGPARGRLPRDLPRPAARAGSPSARGVRPPARAARARRRRASSGSPTASAGPSTGVVDDFVDPAQRRRVRLQPRRRRRRRRPGRRRGRARRRPPRLDAAPALAAAAPRACRAPATRTSRCCSAPAASASPSATARSTLAERPAPRARRRSRCAASWPRSVGLARPARRPTLGELVARTRDLLHSGVPA